MKKAADYRKHAEECRALARGAAVPEERLQLLNMAVMWESLAKDREDFLQRHPEFNAETELS